MMTLKVVVPSPLSLSNIIQHHIDGKNVISSLSKHYVSFALLPLRRPDFHQQQLLLITLAPKPYQLYVPQNLRLRIHDKKKIRVIQNFSMFNIFRYA